jgi:hypothetical protein
VQIPSSAEMPRALRRSRALPSLRALLLNWRRATVDNQAVAFPLALAAYGAVPQSRSAAALAGRRQLFICLGSQNKALEGGNPPRVISQPGNAYPPSIVPAREKLPKGSPRRVQREAAGQIKQIIVSRRSIYRQLVMESLYEEVANPIPVSPDRYPTGLASSAAGSFPRVGRT